MSRLTAVDMKIMNDSVRNLLESIREETGMVPAILQVIANSSAALEGLLAMQKCLDGGVLDKRLRSQIALAVSQANGSAYCVAAHCALGRAEGLSDETLRDARQATSPDRRTGAALEFAKALGERPVPSLDDLISRLRVVGFTEHQVAEIVAHTAVVSLTNYFSHVSDFEWDFPSINLSEADAATNTYDE